MRNNFILNPTVGSLNFLYKQIIQGGISDCVFVFDDIIPFVSICFSKQIIGTIHGCKLSSSISSSIKSVPNSSSVPSINAGRSSSFLYKEISNEFSGREFD
jgi:anthranilate/para-aminobenzoate synthase component II